MFSFFIRELQILGQDNSNWSFEEDKVTFEWTKMQKQRKSNLSFSGKSIIYFTCLFLQALKYLLIMFFIPRLSFHDRAEWSFQCDLNLYILNKNSSKNYGVSQISEFLTQIGNFQSKQLQFYKFIFFCILFRYIVYELH